MSTLRYTPYERLFKDIMKEFDYAGLTADTYFTFATKENYLVEVPLVGITKEELIVKVENGFLVVEAKPAKTSKFVKGTAISFTLAEDADETNVSARLENGLLTVTIPRSASNKRSVNVKIN